MEITILEETPIGEGLFGSVWKATDELSRNLAVKFLHGRGINFKDDILSHAQALSGMNSPNVVQIYGIENVAKPGSSDNEPVIVMEFVGGITFGDWLGKNGKSPEEIYDIISQLIDGVDAFHQAGFVHGDLHSENIVIDGGRLKLIDPAAIDPESAMQTSSLSKDRRRKDIGDLRWLISKAIENTDVLGRVNMVNSMSHSLEELRECVRHFRGMASSAGIAPSVNFYRSAREADAAGSYTKLQDMHRSALRPLESNLKQWVVDTSQVPSGIDEIMPLAFECVEAASNFLSLILCGAESKREETKRYVREIGALAQVPWERRGTVFHASAIEMLVFFFHYFAGAAACSQGNIDSAIAISKTRISFNDHSPIEEIRSNRALTWWPNSLAHDVHHAFNALRRAYVGIPLLRQLWISEADYYSALSSYIFLLSALELVDTDKAYIDELIKTQDYPSLSCPALAVLFPNQIARIGLIRLSNCGDRFISGVLAGSNYSAADLQEYWPKWMMLNERLILRFQYRFHDIDEELKNFKWG